MKYIFSILLLLFCLSISAQTVIDLHTGKVSGRTRDDYNYKAREAWQLREDSIAYDDCVTRAFNFLHEDSLQAAQDLFEKALKLRPDARGNKVIRHNIGRIFMARKQWSDAISLFSNILSEHSRDLEVREDRATCYIEAGQCDKALKDYEYLKMMCPDDEHYRLFHAMMLDRTGEHLDAIDELDEIIASHEDYAECYLIRANVYVSMGNKGYARRDLDQAVALGIPKADIEYLYEKLK